MGGNFYQERDDLSFNKNTFTTKRESPTAGCCGAVRPLSLKAFHRERSRAPIGVVEPLAESPTSVADHVELDDEHARRTTLVGDTHDVSLELDTPLVANSGVCDVHVHDEVHRVFARAVGVEERVDDVGGTGAIRHGRTKQGGCGVGGHTSHLSVSPFALENGRYIDFISIPSVIRR